MPINYRFYLWFIMSLLLASPLFAESETATNCLSLELTIHNKTKQFFYLPFKSNSTSENIETHTLIKPSDTALIHTEIKRIEVVGNLSFSVDLGSGKSIYITDPFTTYPGVFSVRPGSNSEDLQVIINTKKMNDKGMCLFVYAADISIYDGDSQKLY